MTAVPKLDLVDFRSSDAQTRVAFCSALRIALSEFGFVRVVGHRIDPALIRRVYTAFEAFFSQRDSEKTQCASAAGGQRGFTPFGVEHARDQRTPDQKEFYHVGRELDDAHPLREQYPPNVWPKDNPEFRRAACALYDALDRCAMELLEALALGFDLPREAFSEMLRDGNSILRALHYPPVEGKPKGAMRAAPHEDINLITLLCEATDAGLEILTQQGDWLAVPAYPGEIVVDAGDMLSRVTNDVVPSTTHRVIAPSDASERHRYSLPYFAHPYPTCDLSVREAFVRPGEAPRYPPTRAAAFLNERLKEIGLID